MGGKDVDPKAEVARIKAKMGAVQDRDIRAALQARIDELTAQIVEEPEPEAAAEEPKEPPPPPTPEQAEKAERLVRQAMLEKQRGNKAAVSKLLEEAVAVAPGAPATLEALGDDFAERRRAKEAIELYKRAMELDPKNVGLEKKHAMLVFNVGTAGTIEEQLRANLSDSMFIGQGDAIASFGAARFVSYFFPGLGHVILGRAAVGFGLLAGWVACLLWIILVQVNAGGKGRLSSGLFPPVFIGAVILIYAVGSLGSARGGGRPKSGPPRPKPPVDLPFD